MNVQIELPDEIVTALAHQAAAAGKDLPKFAAEVLTERAIDKLPVVDEQTPHEEFMARLHRIIAMHRPTYGRLDDSRESIYAGCGE